MAEPKYELSDSDAAEICKRFTYQPPKQDQPERHERIRSNARTVALEIMQACPPSRERALALTAIEESVMWANAAIARNE
jgi:hypothetical protein